MHAIPHTSGGLVIGANAVHEPGSSMLPLVHDVASRRNGHGLNDAELLVESEFTLACCLTMQVPSGVTLSPIRAELWSANGSDAFRLDD